MDYKEKLRLATEALNSGSYDKETIEYIFPELKESEDERIRKEIIEQINLLKSATLSDLRDKQFDSWIAWLEKQKVLSTEEDMQGKEDVLWCIKQAKKYAKDENEMGTCWFAEKWLQKQGEQKPVIEMKSAEESLGIDSDTYNKIVDECIFGEQKSEEIDNLHNYLYGERKPVKVPKFKVGDFIQFNGMGHSRYTIKEVCGLSHYINSCDRRMDMAYTDANFELVEQKPAWSEEDEEILDSIIVDVEVLKGQDRTKGGKAVYQEEIDWLKSIKDRVQPQPKQEWSEEVENRFNNLIFLVECSDENEPTKKGFINFINRLKSIRHYKKWWPSDEQMEALLSTLPIIKGHGNSVQSILETLYDELKELKGEKV